MWHDGGQHSPSLQSISPVDITSNDPRQSGDERGEVIPSWDEIEAWWEAGLLDPKRRRNRKTVSCLALKTREGIR